MNQDLLKLLQALKRMSEGEDWDESRAQELVQWGGELHDKYASQISRRIDDAGQH